jgi:uncharacterized membrane protein YeaQ/YmgE (transglycosylase-associated protein family)
MTVIRDNLNWIVGLIVGGIVAFLSWSYVSGLFSTIVAVLVGAGIAYIVQTRTQRNAWKREYSVKIAETVYGNLYPEVKGILSTLKKGAFFVITFGKWQEFQSDHRHLMVEKDFREQLDEFSKKVDEYNRNLIRLNAEVFLSIVNEASKEVFGLIADRINITVKYKTGSGFSSQIWDPLYCLARGNHPRELVKEDYPRSENVSIQVDFGNVRQTFGNGLQPLTADEAKFDEFWKLCIEKEQNNETYRLTLQEKSVLLEESEHIFRELTKRIEEPWRI